MEEKNWSEIVLDLNKTMEERIQAAFHLQHSTNREEVSKLIKGLFTDPSPIVRHEFAFALGENCDPSFVAPYLMKAVETDKNVFVRHEAVLALATLGKKEFIPFVKKFVNDPIPEMAESAQIALERLEQTDS